MRFKSITRHVSLPNRRRQAILGLVTITGLIAVACGSTEPTATVPNTSTPIADAPASTSTLTPTLKPPYGVAGPPAPPPLDTSTAIVSPEDIIFDTFNGRSVALSDADQETIDGLFNAIKPVYTPAYVNADGGRWLFDRDFVVGYEGDSQAYAYPVKFLNSHEIVNDEIDGIPILVTYCPLCGSGVVFDRRLNGETHIFGNTSALYQNDLVIVDHETGSYWFQTGGEAVIGPLSGSRLDPLPSVMMPWVEWVKLHPETLVLSRDQGFSIPPSRYDNDPFDGYPRVVEAGRFPFPVDQDRVGDQLKLSEIVVSVRVGDIEKAYPPGLIGDAAVNDEIDGQPVVVFSRQNGPFATAFSPVVDGQTLTFTIDSSTADGSYTDDQTKTIWDVTGRAVQGELAGKRINALPSRRAMWFSISIAQPDIEVYLP